MDIITLNYETFENIINKLNENGNITFNLNDTNFFLLNISSILFLIFLAIILINLIKFIGKLIK